MIASVFHFFALWLVQKIRATSSNSQIKIKSNRDLVNDVFPRFKQFSWFNFDLSLAARDNLFIVIGDLSCVSIFWDDRAMLIW